MDRRSFIRTAAAAGALATGLGRFASVAGAQSGLTRSIYVMPYVDVTTSHGPSKQPKYQSLFVDLNRGIFNYGDESWCMVGLMDVPQATDDALNANADVFEFPANLDQTMGTTVVRDTWRNRLESTDVPGTWVQTTTTYRDIARFYGAVCQFAQRFQGISGIPANRWFAGNRTLSSTFGSLGAAAQQALLDTADSFGFDRSNLTGTTTLRQFLKSAGDQYNAAGLPLDLAGPL